MTLRLMENSISNPFLDLHAAFDGHAFPPTAPSQLDLLDMDLPEEPSNHEKEMTMTTSNPMQLGMVGLGRMGAAVAEVWRRGSVIESWLLDLTAAALFDSPDLENFAGRFSDSGEGRWTSIAAIDEGVPAPVLTTALYSRFASRGLDDFADKVLSVMRKGFGGHDEKKA
jgi:hypothetical protein